MSERERNKSAWQTARDSVSRKPGTAAGGTAAFVAGGVATMTESGRKTAAAVVGTAPEPVSGFPPNVAAGVLIIVGVFALSAVFSDEG